MRHGRKSRSSHFVRKRSDKLEIYCKAWPVREGEALLGSRHLLWIGTSRSLVVKQGTGDAFRPPVELCIFPKISVPNAPLKPQCTTSAKGRSVSIHPDEALLIELRARQQTPQGRAHLRERVAVEHTLAHVGWWQGRRARYRGTRKNLFDLRRCAVVHNLHVLACSQQLSAEFQEAA